MKKIIFVIPFMAISLLYSCDSNPTPSIKEYFVSFETFGGTPIKTQRVKEGDKATPPENPIRGDDDFGGWFIDTEYKTVYTFNETVTDDITLYAKWNRTHQITLDAGDGLFFTGKNKMTFKVAENINLSKFVKSFDRPIKISDTFASYTYEDGSSIDYDDLVKGDLTLTANYIGSATPLTDLDEVSWKTIHDVAVTNNKIDTCFALGASKHIDVYGYNHELRIIGFNHDELTISTEENPQYAGITFEFFNVITKFSEITQTPLCVLVRWESPSIHVNHKYSTSTLRNFLNEGNDSIFNELPDELREEGIIKEVYRPVTEKQTAESDYEINTSYTDKLFPLSYYEVIGESSGETLDEGIQYPYWEIHNTEDERKKYDVGGSTTERAYWLRSPVINSTSEDFAWTINTGGIPDDKVTVSYAGLPVAPAFCI